MVIKRSSSKKGSMKLGSNIAGGLRGGKRRMNRACVEEEFDLRGRRQDSSCAGIAVVWNCYSQVNIFSLQSTSILPSPRSHTLTLILRFTNDSTAVPCARILPTFAWNTLTYLPEIQHHREEDTPQDKAPRQWPHCPSLWLRIQPFVEAARFSPSCLQPAKPILNDDS